MGRELSDGTMRCPAPSDTGLPCQKRIPQGWTADEGHSGGHWWESDAHREFMDTAHYDAELLLSGLPFEAHSPADCPGAPKCLR